MNQIWITFLWKSKINQEKSGEMLLFLILLVNLMHLVIEIYREYNAWKRALQHRMMVENHRRNRQRMQNQNNNRDDDGDLTD